jgi:hypothetical protein
LIKANRALFDEAAIRHGFMGLRKNKSINLITTEEYFEANTILDRLRTAIEELPGEQLAWRKETANALSLAKTSVGNIYVASSLNPAQLQQYFENSIK